MSDDEGRVYIFAYDDRIEIGMGQGERLSVGEEVDFQIFADDHDVVHIARSLNGTWVPYATVKEGIFTSGMYAWSDPGNYTIHFADARPGEGVHANVTIYTVRDGCVPPYCHYYPADEFFEHVHEDGALHYHPRPAPNGTR